MKFIVAIDPGNQESAYVILGAGLRPLFFEKAENEKMWADIQNSMTYLQVYTNGDAQFMPVIEMVASYGMPVGAEVFETCVWIGRFMERFGKLIGTYPAWLYRKEEKINLCGSMRAKDSNITQALADRFAPNQPNHGKGTKKKPGWFYGFKKDVWAAYAVGVTYYDKLQEQERNNK